MKCLQLINSNYIILHYGNHWITYIVWGHSVESNQFASRFICNINCRNGLFITSLKLSSWSLHIIYVHINLFYSYLIKFKKYDYCRYSHIIDRVYQTSIYSNRNKPQHLQIVSVSHRLITQQPKMSAWLNSQLVAFALSSVLSSDLMSKALSNYMFYANV